VFFATRKTKRGYYEMELKLITEEADSKNWGEITEEHTRLLEMEIQKAPQYWIWSHKRWKREVPTDLEQLKKEQHAKFDQRYKPA
jgi:KDO2-lipid IV(A) lauroyltransferase